MTKALTVMTADQLDIFHYLQPRPGDVIAIIKARW